VVVRRVERGSCVGWTQEPQTAPWTTRCWLGRDLPGASRDGFGSGLCCKRCSPLLFNKPHSCQGGVFSLKTTRGSADTFPGMKLSQMIHNALMTTRQEWLQRTFGNGTKDVEKECGHPIEVGTDDCFTAFTRGDIANRIISIYPDECWGENPEVYETEKEEETEFEKAWEEIQTKFNLYSYLHRADVLSGIGRFGILLLGFDGSVDLAQPVSPGAHKLLYVRPFEEKFVRVATFETNLSNPRFGQPLTYSITFQEAGVSGATPMPSQQMTVHWTRVIHFADNRTNSDIYGLPRLEKVYNRVIDLKKVAGGAGEMFWKGGFPGLSVESIPVDGGDVDFDEEATKEQMQAYMNGMQRYIATVGMSVKSLAIQIADPRPHMEVQIRLIAIATGIPWRILMGVEVGQLASEQDMRAWNRRLKKRREQYINPFILHPLIDRLVEFGVLPKPAEVKIHWPDLNSPTDADKAAVSEKITNALAKYVQSGVDLMIPPFYFLTLVAGLSDDEATACIEAAKNKGTDGLDLTPKPVPTTNPTGSNTPPRGKNV